jgi:hypothetical protein
MVKDEDEARCSFPDLGMVDGGGWLEVASRHIRRNSRHFATWFIDSSARGKGIRQSINTVNRLSGRLWNVSIDTVNQQLLLVSINNGVTSYNFMTSGYNCLNM